jgi:hypothetical protein
MAINFNSLPTDKPNNLPETGTYYATIDSAEMKQGKDPTKPPYLNIALAIKDKTGKSCGKIYDILSESDKELVQYKLARFLIALDLAKLGTFELVDLVKVIKNKQLIVDVKREEAKDGYPEKAVVDVFGGSIYYPLSEATTIFGTPAPKKEESIVDSFKPVEEDSLDIFASDAADVHTAEDDDF